MARTTKEEERKTRKEEEAAEKERARLEKEEKRKSKDSKPGRFSALLGRGTGVSGSTVVAPKTESSAPRKSTDLKDEETSNKATVADTATLSTSTATEPKTFHDAVTHDTPESVPAKITKVESASDAPMAIKSTPAVAEETGEKKLESQKLADDQPSDPASTSKPRGRSWIQRLRGKSNAQKDENVSQSTQQKPKTAENDTPITRSDSMQNVAMAGRTESKETNDLHGTGRDVSPERATAEAAGRSRTSSVSSLSRRNSSEFKPNTNFSLGTTEPTQEESRGDEGVRRKLLKKIRPGKEKSKDDPTTGPSDDEFEEARDKFDEDRDKLAPPPALSSLTGENSRALSPKGSRERSRFTEEL